MALEQIDVMMPWVLDAEGIPQPRILTDYPGGNYVDITGTPTADIINDPNSVVARYIVDSVIVQQIAADINYTIQPATRSAPGSEDPTLDNVMSNAEYAQYRTEVLAMINPATGKKPWNAGQWNQAIGPNNDAGRTKREINSQLIAWIETTLKADPIAGYIIGAANQSDTFVGWREGGSGTISNKFYRDMELEHTEEGTGADNGTFRLKMKVVGPPVDVNIFGQLVFPTEGVTLRTDATSNFDYDEASQQWTWFATGLNFADGVDYGMDIVAVIPPEEVGSRILIQISDGPLTTTWEG